ncbi:MAG TPA: hypothetical protein VG496_05450 [Myxococcales bacterium]|nr:hypothetical protein [Myxococcales bacterium]
MKKLFCTRMPGVAAVLLSGAVACGGSDYAAPAPPAAASPSLTLSSNATLGNFLVDGNGRSLYYFGKDFPASASSAAVSNCSGACAAAWPIFHAANDVVQGLNAADVGQITRSDGSPQTTYKGWPLYYFAGDANAGDVNGQGVGEVWFVLHADLYSVALMSNPNGQQPTLYLSDGAGRTLYYFFRDTPGNATTDPVSACTTATCLASWLVFSAQNVVVPSALAGSDFSVFTRTDGAVQAAYKGHPLYYFAGDTKPGDTNGRGVNNAWDSLDPRNF